MATGMHVFYEIAERHGVNVKDPLAIDCWYEHELINLPEELRAAVGQELLDRDGEPDPLPGREQPVSGSEAAPPAPRWSLVADFLDSQLSAYREKNWSDQAERDHINGILHLSCMGLLFPRAIQTPQLWTDGAVCALINEVRHGFTEDLYAATYRDEVPSPLGVEVVRWLRLDMMERWLSTDWRWFADYDHYRRLIEWLQMEPGGLISAPLEILPDESALLSIRLLDFVGQLIPLWRQCILQRLDAEDMHAFVSGQFGGIDPFRLLRAIGQVAYRQAGQRMGGDLEARALCAGGVNRALSWMGHAHHLWDSPVVDLYSHPNAWTNLMRIAERLQWLCSIMSVCGERGLWMLWESSVPVELEGMVKPAAGRASCESLENSRIDSYGQRGRLARYVDCHSFAYSYDINMSYMGSTSSE